MAHHPSPARCLTHRYAYGAGCPDCQRYRRLLTARRSRAKAYGIWRPWGDLDATRTHIEDLQADGMSLRQIARLAGVDKNTVRDIVNGMRYTVSATTTTQIRMVVPVDPDRVDVTGTTRRLRALACAGYSAQTCARMLGVSKNSLSRWINASQPTLRRVFREQIRQLYAQLWDTAGPDGYAAVAATAMGWCPFEAWTDATIDDPQASPYSHPEMHEYIDREKLRRVRLPKGHPMRVLFEQLTGAEQAELYRMHIQAGGSPRGFRDKYRPVPIGILRQLTREVA